MIIGVRQIYFLIDLFQISIPSFEYIFNSKKIPVIFIFQEDLVEKGSAIRKAAISTPVPDNKYITTDNRNI